MEALVTGAGRGIGAAIARRLARDGYDIVLHYHQDEAGARATADAVRALGRRAVVSRADLGDPEAPDRLAAAALDAFPDLTLLVNNAGVYERAALADLDAAAWRRTMQVDLDAPAALCRALAPTLRRTHGAIVNLSSIAAVRGSGHGAHYTSAKAGLLGLTRALARELAPDVRVNAVCPGYIATDMIGQDPPAKRADRAAEVPLGRVGEPEDVAGVVSFLAGPDAAYLTGQTLHVDGGLWTG